MHGKIKKKQLEKILDDLEEDGKIIAKEYGKAKIYFYNQLLHPQLEAEELNKVKDEQDKARKMNLDLTTRIKELKADIQRLEKTPTIGELNNEIEELKKRKEFMEEEIIKYKSGGVELVSDETIKKIEQERDKIQTIMKKRIKIVKDLIDSVGEGLELKSDKVMDLMGLEN